MEDADDLEGILSGIQLQQVYALYDEESESMYVLSDATSIGPVEELGYASAYVLGLQQASFDISGLRSTAREIDADHFNAVNALKRAISRRSVPDTWRLSSHKRTLMCFEHLLLKTSCSKRQG